jgi:hypothetical protein
MLLAIGALSLAALALERALAGEYGDLVNWRELRRFVASHPAVKMALFSPTPNPEPEQLARDAGMTLISMRPYLQGKPREYQDIHPPARIYPLYAKVLLQELVRLKLLSLPTPIHRT